MHRKKNRLENHEIAKVYCGGNSSVVGRLSGWSQSVCLLEEAPLVGAAEYFKLTPFQVSKRPGTSHAMCCFCRELENKRKVDNHFVSHYPELEIIYIQAEVPLY